MNACVKNTDVNWVRGTRMKEQVYDFYMLIRLSCDLINNMVSACIISWFTVCEKLGF